MSENELRQVEDAVLSALEDLGGIATRIREIRDARALPQDREAFIAAEAREDIVQWLDAAGSTLGNSAAQLIAMERAKS